MIKLKPSTSYDFTPSDYDLIKELMKVGYVHTLSNQVSLMTYDQKVLSFKHSDMNETKNCNGLQLPDNWYVEHICRRDNSISITFGINNKGAKT